MPDAPRRIGQFGPSPTRSTVTTMQPERQLVMRVVIVLVLASAVVAGLGVATYVSVTAYDRLTATQPRCGAEPDNIQDPTSFTAWIEVDGQRRDVDTTPYRMPPPLTVSFPARGDPGITIVGWWEPAVRTGGAPAAPVGPLDAPTVIVTHGLNGCRHNSGNLLVAGMLHRNGFAVLLIDMRDHGDSTVEDARYAGGTEEYGDVLGAFDWLRGQGVPAARIGLFGFSGGAIASMIAMAEEPGLRAIWADSSWTTADAVIRDGLAANDVPTFLDLGVLLVARLHGDDLTVRSPLAAAAHFAGRPVFLVQGASDDMLNPGYLAELAHAIRSAGGTVESWQVPAAAHTQAHFLYPAEYEARLAAFFGRALA
jgi:pimeloyl-ACP methyl ester carboxylesterase